MNFFPPYLLFYTLEYYTIDAGVMKMFNSHTYSTPWHTYTQVSCCRQWLTESKTISSVVHAAAAAAAAAQLTVVRGTGDVAFVTGAGYSWSIGVRCGWLPACISTLWSASAQPVFVQTYMTTQTHSSFFFFSLSLSRVLWSVSWKFRRQCHRHSFHTSSVPVKVDK